MAVTVLTSGVQYSISILSGPEADWVKGSLTIIMMALAVIVSVDCAIKWVRILKCPKCPTGSNPDRDLMGLAQGIDIKD
jgi:hypothetical protein